MSKIFPLLTIFIFIIASYFLKIYPPPTISYLQQTEQCFLDGQIPCRWTQSPDNPYGHFIFAQQGGLIYYISMFFRLFGFDYQLSILIPLLLASLSIIYFGYQLFKPHLATTKAFILALIISVISYSLSITLPIFGLVIFFLVINKNLYLSSLAIASILVSTPTNNLLPAILIILISYLPLVFKHLKNFLLSISLAVFLISFYLGPSLSENKYSNNSNSLIDTISAPLTTQGEAEISQYRYRSNFWRFTITVNQNDPAIIVVPMYYYSNWTILIDQHITLPQSSDVIQLTKISVPPGNHTVVAFLQDSKINTLFNLLSLITFVYIFIALFPKSAYKSI